jgi:hypothetical protein
MQKRTILLFTLVLVFALGALAADISGKWTAQVPGRDGQTRDVTFTFKQSGDSLTGNMSGRENPIPIADGKVSGDTVSFVVTMERGGNTMKQTYTGKISGDEIKFKREGGQGQPREFTAKRAK